MKLWPYGPWLLFANFTSYNSMRFGFHPMVRAREMGEYFVRTGQWADYRIEYVAVCAVV